MARKTPTQPAPTPLKSRSADAVATGPADSVSSIEDRLSDVKEALALALLMARSLASSDDVCMGNEEQGYAWDAIADKLQDAFHATRAIGAALPNTVMFLAAPFVDEAQ